MPRIRITTAHVRPRSTGRASAWYWLCNSDVWSLLCSASRQLRLLLTSRCRRPPPFDVENLALLTAPFTSLI